MIGDGALVQSDVGDLWLPADDKVILPYLRNAGVWEPDEGRLLRSLLTPGCSFLDVGANVGYFSALAARHGAASVDAVEPEPRNLAFLRLNLWAHAGHAQIWPVALGIERRVVALSTEPNNPGNTQVIAAAARASRLAAMVPGDELFGGRRFDVIKVDVQGFEREVLLGLRETIRRSRRVSVVTEFFPAALSARGLDPLAALDAYRSLGLHRMVSLNGQLLSLSDDELLGLCATSGRQGFVNLLLRAEVS